MSRSNRDRRAGKESWPKVPDGLIVVPQRLSGTHDPEALRRAAREVVRRDFGGRTALTCALLAGDTGIVPNVVVHRGRMVVAHVRLPVGRLEPIWGMLSEYGGERVYFVVASPRTRDETEWYWLVDPRDESVHRTPDFKVWHVANRPGDWEQVNVIDLLRA